MRKSSFMKLVLLVLCAFVFAIGMCMCLLPEWNSFNLGVILTAVGGGALLIWGVAEFFIHGLHRAHFNVKLVLKIAYCTLSLLVLGAGMALILAMDQFAIGLVLGGVGIVMSLFIIPVVFGLK